MGFAPLPMAATPFGALLLPPHPNLIGLMVPAYPAMMMAFNPAMLGFGAMQPFGGYSMPQTMFGARPGPFGAPQYHAPVGRYSPQYQGLGGSPHYQGLGGSPQYQAPRSGVDHGFTMPGDRAPQLSSSTHRHGRSPVVELARQAPAHSVAQPPARREAPPRPPPPKRRPAHVEERRPAHVEERRPAHVEERQPANVEARRPAHVEERQPANVEARRREVDHHPATPKPRLDSAPARLEGPPKPRLTPQPRSSSSPSHLANAQQHERGVTAKPSAEQHERGATAKPLAVQHDRGVTAKPVTEQHDRGVTAKPSAEQHERGATAKPVTEPHDRGVTAKPVAAQHDRDITASSTAPAKTTTAPRGRDDALTRLQRLEDGVKTQLADVDRGLSTERDPLRRLSLIKRQLQLHSRHAKIRSMMGKALRTRPVGHAPQVPARPKAAPPKTGGDPSPARQTPKLSKTGGNPTTARQTPKPTARQTPKQPEIVGNPPTARKAPKQLRAEGRDLRRRARDTAAAQREQRRAQAKLQRDARRAASAKAREQQQLQRRQQRMDAAKTRETAKSRQAAKRIADLEKQLPKLERDAVRREAHAQKRLDRAMGEFDVQARKLAGVERALDRGFARLDNTSTSEVDALMRELQDEAASDLARQLPSVPTTPLA